MGARKEALCVCSEARGDWTRTLCVFCDAARKGFGAARTFCRESRKVPRRGQIAHCVVCSDCVRRSRVLAEEFKPSSSRTMPVTDGTERLFSRGCASITRGRGNVSCALYSCVFILFYGLETIQK